MSSVVLAFEDTISVNTRVIVDVSTGTYSEITFPDELINIESGKNGNAILTRKTAGYKADLTLRVILGSEDDKFLNNLLIKQNQNAVDFSLLQSSIVKSTRNNDKKTETTYNLSNGAFMKNIDTISTTEGGVEQVIAVYKMRFSDSSRTMG